MMMRATTKDLVSPRRRVTLPAHTRRSLGADFFRIRAAGASSAHTRGAFARFGCDRATQCMCMCMCFWICICFFRFCFCYFALCNVYYAYLFLADAVVVLLLPSLLVLKRYLYYLVARS